MRLIKAFNLTGARFDRMEKTFRNLKSLSIKLEAGSGPTVLLSGFVLHGGFDRHHLVRIDVPFRRVRFPCRFILCF